MGHFQVDSRYRVVNPAAGDDFFDQTGTALDSQGDFSDSKNPAVQPTVDSGRAKGLYSDRELLGNVAHGIQVGVHGSQVIGSNDIGYAAWGASVSITSVAAVSGKAVYTLNSHGLSVGDILNVTDSNDVVGGSQRITAVTVNTFTTTKDYSSGAGTLAYRPSQGTHFASMSIDKWIMRRVTDEVAGGISNYVLRSGASDFQIRRSIHKLEHLYTRRVATAIRAGYWHIYEGRFTTEPTTADDVSTWGNDHAATPSYAVPGELVYRDGSPIPVQNDYKPKTG